MSRKAPKTETVSNPSIISVKGFDANFQCRGYQFEVGKTFVHDGKVEVCSGGFHACEYPLDVFSYYEPATSRYALVTQSGATNCEIGGDSKIASARITIEAELKIPDLVARAFNWIGTRCDGEKGKHTEGNSSASSVTGDRSASSVTGYGSASSATGDSSASSVTGYGSASSATGDSSASSATGYGSASSATGDRSASSATGYGSASSVTGYRSASSATGYRSASSATGYGSASSVTGYRSASSVTGYRSASSATGDRSASSVTGDRSASSATGDRSASSATGKAAIALNTGRAGKARASEGGAIVLCVHDGGGNLLHIRASKVGESGIKPDIFYMLSEAGEFVEAAS